MSSSAAHQQPYLRSTTPAETAASLLERGYLPVPIPRGKNHPVLKGWPDFTADRDRLPEQFPEDEAVGVILGRRSGGLVDVDIDFDAPVEVYEVFLPATGLVSGRLSRPGTHRFYLCKEGVSVTLKAPDGAVLVEVRGNGRQAVMPPSIHPEGEGLRWDRNEAPSSVGCGELEDAVHRLAAVGLLAHYWPSEGSRHEYALATSGYLLRHGLSEDMTAAIVRAAAISAHDSEVTDRVRAVGDSAKRLRSGESVIGGPRLAELADEEKILDLLGKWLNLRRQPGLPTVESHATGLALSFVPLEHVLEAGKKPPVWLYQPLIPEGHVVVLYGAPGSGKTMLALWIAKELIEDGRGVAYLDADSGRKVIGRRLRSMGITSASASLFSYFEYPPTAGLMSDDFGKLLADARPSLVILDSAADFLVGAGMDEDSGGDVSRWFGAISQAARQLDISLLVLDHITKSGDARAPRGSGAKVSKADITWYIGEGKLQPGGFVELTCNKDREGMCPPRLSFVFRKREDLLSFDRCLGANPPVADTREQVVLGALREAGAKGLSRADIEGMLKLSRSTVSDLLARMVRSGLITTNGKTRGARYFTTSSSEEDQSSASSAPLTGGESEEVSEVEETILKEDGGPR